MNVKRLCCLLVTMLCLSLAGVQPAVAQEIALVGTIQDETGGALPGVTVTARHLSTGNTFLGVTDATGIYRIGAMRPGEYSVEAVLSGFATLVQEQVALLVGQVGTLDFNMTVAGVAETVTVTSEAPLVDLQQSSMGGAINPLQMEELPINGRDWVQLTMMAPGSRVNSTGAGLSPSGLWATDYQINLDGQAISQTYSLSRLGQPRFSRDAIAEFEVVSSRFDATQGRSTGMQVNAVTKSGTNQFSGSLGGYFRHDSLNAKDFFADRVLPYQNQQVSATFGGPIIEDKVHFFAHFENEREPQSYFFNSPVPEFNDLGNGPDGTGLPFTYSSQLFGGRLDGQLTDSTRLMVRGNGWLTDELHQPFQALANHPSTLLAKDYVSRQFFGTLTRASGTTVNEFKVGLNHFANNTFSFYGLGTGLEFGTTPQVRLAGVTIGPSHIINGANQSQENWSVRNDFTMLKGGHTLKIGGELLIPSYYLFTPTDRDGRLFAQAGAFPANIAELFPSNDPSTWNLDALAPITQRWSQTAGRYDTHAATCDGDPGPAPAAADPSGGCWRTKTNLAWWVQDDWQVSDNLTLNLGLRWDFSEDIMANDIDLTSIRAPQFANDPIRAGTDQQLNMFQPRLGFAYALNENRTVVRGGWGLYFSGGNDVISISTEFPLAYQSVANPNDGRPDFPSNPFAHFPGGRQPTFQEVLDGAHAGLYRIDLTGVITPDDARVPYTHQVTIGFQQQIGNTMSFQADYVFQGFRNGRYPRNENLTYDPATGLNRPYSDPSTRKWPDMGIVRVFEHGKTAEYHGLEMAFTKRFDQGYQLSATYTVGESTSCSPSPVDGAFPVARDLGDDCWFTTQSDGGPGHQRHRAVFNGIWDLGYDFQLSGLYHYGSGQRFDSYSVFDLRNTGGFFWPWPASAQRLEADGSIIDHGAVQGEAIHRVDMRVMRRFNVGEVSIDGMLEVFNLFNYENYGAYQACVCAPTYATPLFIAAPAYQPRIVQLAFRVGF